MSHPFWFGLMILCVGWYSSVTVYVAIRGAFDIRHMLENLKNSHGAQNGSGEG